MNLIQPWIINSSDNRGLISFSFLVTINCQEAARVAPLSAEQKQNIHKWFFIERIFSLAKIFIVKSEIKRHKERESGRRRLRKKLICVGKNDLKRDWHAKVFPFIILNLTTIFYGKFDTVVDSIVWHKIAQISEKIIIYQAAKRLRNALQGNVIFLTLNSVEEITCFERILNEDCEKSFAKISHENYLR